MPDTYDWPRFYESLCALGPRLLTGIDAGIREIVEGVSATDAFWSDGLEELLADGAADGELRRGVLAALEEWRDNVVRVLSGEFSFDLEAGSIGIDAGSPLVDDLVDAARADT